MVFCDLAAAAFGGGVTSVTADEGSTLKATDNLDRAYKQLIRPWKSRLPLFYVDRQSNWLDTKLIITTVLSIIARENVVQLVGRETWNMHFIWYYSPTFYAHK